MFPFRQNSKSSQFLESLVDKYNIAKLVGAVVAIIVVVVVAALVVISVVLNGVVAAVVVRISMTSG